MRALALVAVFTFAANAHAQFRLPSLDVNRLVDTVKNVGKAVKEIDEPEEISIGKDVASRLLGAAPLVPVRATLKSCVMPLAPAFAGAVPPKRSASMRTQPSPASPFTRVQPPLRSSASTAVFSAREATVAASVAGCCLRSVARMTVAGSAQARAGTQISKNRRFMAFVLVRTALRAAPVP